jgi:hypothetical protein
MADFRWPSTSQRTAVIGRTGSGKTRFGWWMLSRSAFDTIPIILIDYKREGLFQSVDRIREIGLNDVPKQPGLYVIRPMVGDDEAVEKWMWKVWQRENVGLYIDEGYMLPQNPRGAFTAILTQGRSKHIPVFCLSQRPSWLSRFVFSEADFFAVFQLSDADDQKTAQRYIKRDRVDLQVELQDYHSYWYDVARREAFHLAPVPDENLISEHIRRRLAPKKREI